MSAFTVSPKKDPQRHRVYSMESDLFIGWQRVPLSRRTIRAFADQVCEHLGVPKVVIRYTGAGNGNAGAFQTPKTIHFNAKPLPPLYVLTHELAHYVLFQFCLKMDVDPYQYDDHGPNFVGTHALILHLMQLCPLPMYLAATAAYGISYVHPLTGHLQRARRRAKVSSVRFAHPALDKSLLKARRSSRSASRPSARRASARRAAS